MAAKSDYLKTKILRAVMYGEALPAPANFYARLYTTSVTASGGGTEVSGGAYAAQAIPRDDDNWTLSGGGLLMQNTNQIIFPTATAAWGTVKAVALWDALSGGNMWYYSADFLDPVTISTGGIFSFAAGDISLTEV